MEYGADNCFKQLRSVLLCKPDNYNIGKPLNMWQERYKGKVDFDLARRQYEIMVEELNGAGVKCNFLAPIDGAIEQKDTRDLGLISSRGAIFGSFKRKIRHLEVQEFQRFLNKNKIKVIGKKPFEGGDFFFINDSLMLIGVGIRTDIKAKEIEHLLNRKIEVVHHSASHHLDAFFNFASEDLVVAYKDGIKDKDFLKGKDVVALSKKDMWNMCSNFLLIKENKILADSGCHEFNKKLEKKGVEVIETDVSELKKNGGSVRCMTLEIERR